MATSRPSAAWLLMATFLCSVAVPNMATVYTVGDSAGWGIGPDYTTWTSGKTFAVGDRLVFNYRGGHSVDEVTENDFNTCTVGNSIQSDSSGTTTIPLKSTGTHYYICGSMGHCGSGMKLAVTVSSGAGGSAAAAATPSDDSPTVNTTSTGTTLNTPTTGKVPVDSSSATSLSPLMAAALITWVGSWVLNLERCIRGSYVI